MGIRDENKTTKITLNKTFLKKSATVIEIRFFKITNRQYNAIIEIPILTIKVTSGSNPNFKKKYEMGKFKFNKPPATPWYIFILPEACAAVTNGPEILSIRILIITNWVKMMV